MMTEAQARAIYGQSGLRVRAEHGDTGARDLRDATYALIQMYRKADDRRRRTDVLWGLTSVLAAREE
jgi:hypothetical protein